MHKILALSLVTAATLAACGGGDDDKQSLRTLDGKAPLVIATADSRACTPRRPAPPMKRQPTPAPIRSSSTCTSPRTACWWRATTPAQGQHQH